MNTLHAPLPLQPRPNSHSRPAQRSRLLKPITSKEAHLPPPSPLLLPPSLSRSAAALGVAHPRAGGGKGLAGNEVCRVQGKGEFVSPSPSLGGRGKVVAVKSTGTQNQVKTGTVGPRWENAEVERGTFPNSVSLPWTVSVESPHPSSPQKLAPYPAAHSPLSPDPALTLPSSLPPASNPPHPPSLPFKLHTPTSTPASPNPFLGRFRPRLRSTQLGHSVSSISTTAFTSSSGKSTPSSFRSTATATSASSPTEGWKRICTCSVEYEDESTTDSEGSEGESGSEGRKGREEQGW